MTSQTEPAVLASDKVLVSRAVIQEAYDIIRWTGPSNVANALLRAVSTTPGKSGGE